MPPINKTLKQKKIGTLPVKSLGKLPSSKSKIPEHPRGETCKFTSNTLPAGGSLPIRIPPGQKILSVSNPFDGEGKVTFVLNGVTREMFYSPKEVDLGSVYDFIDPVNMDYSFHNIAGMIPSGVIINVDDFI